MAWLFSKYLISAALVVFVSEAAKRSDKLGGFIAALPLITFMALIWLHVEKQPEQKSSLLKDPPAFGAGGFLKKEEDLI